MGAVRGTWGFAGKLLGMITFLGPGVVLLALREGPGLGIVGVILGVLAGFPIVRFGLMRIGRARLVVRWLYPYEGWTGDEQGNLTPL